MPRGEVVPQGLEDDRVLDVARVPQQTDHFTEDADRRRLGDGRDPRLDDALERTRVYYFAMHEGFQRCYRIPHDEAPSSRRIAHVHSMATQ